MRASQRRCLPAGVCPTMAAVAGLLVLLSARVAPGGLPLPPCPVSTTGICDAALCGFNSTGGGDSSAALQAALSSAAHTVLIRNMGTPWLVGATPSLHRPAVTVEFQRGAVLAALPGAAAVYMGVIYVSYRRS